MTGWIVVLLFWFLTLSKIVWTMPIEMRRHRRTLSALLVGLRLGLLGAIVVLVILEVLQ